MEYVKVQISKENIKRVKEFGSFAKVINSLVELTIEKEIQTKLKNLIKDKTK